jgi:transcription initiation factor TFIIF subunit alpha
MAAGLKFKCANVDVSQSENESEDDEDQNQAKVEDEDKDKDKTEAQGSAVGKVATTPSSKLKTPDTPKKMKTLKRPGSPNLSESSGNESARKKAKKAKAASASARPSRSSTPVPGGQSQTVGQRRKMGADSTSDGEATGGEMSDGQPKKKKIKLVPSGGRSTPAGSRPGSPLPYPPTGKFPSLAVSCTGRLCD